jgi:DNA-binding NarL/FixJ family response regulator
MSEGSAIGWFAESIRLSGRQRSVFTLLVGGEAPKQIASKLNISHVTVRRHLEEIYSKSGTENQRELLALFARVLMRVGKSNEAPDCKVAANGV